MIIGGYGTNLAINDPNVDHPEKMLELILTPRTLYCHALDEVCKVFASVDGVGNNFILNRDVKIGDASDSHELAELLPQMIWNDILKRYPKYQYDIAQAVVQENRSELKGS